ncbi:sulfatase-like hydrolase/transferase [Halarchaeum salinum]|uniref:Sulfatase n=1 Tax=Halarchaeum salinum TaxID=489912 RepID=A0AAV3S691_9EURY
MTNIALVVLDTLRKNSFDEHFQWLPGTRFENAWSTSHWTVPAHGSLFTGRYASEIGVHTDASSLDCERPVLAERLRDAGYSTRAFSANVNVSENFSFDRGFDEFEGSWRLRALTENFFNWDQFLVKNEGAGPTRYLRALRQCVAGDCDTLPSLKRGALLKLRDLGIGSRTQDDGATEALGYVRSTDFGDSEFLFMNLMEAHTPYNPPEEYRTVDPPGLDGLKASVRSPNATPDQIRQAYADGVRYLSDMYREIFSELREEFDVVVTVSDHGEVLGEHGMWEHQCGLYPELTHVPLSIYTGEGSGDVVSSSVSLLDVNQTILTLAGLSADSRGQDLLADTVENGEFLTEFHGISDLHRNALDKQGITDIDDLKQELNGICFGGYYGYETFDGFEEINESPFEDPQKQLSERVGELDKEHTSREDQDLDDAVMDQLEDLGYA